MTASAADDCSASAGGVKQPAAFGWWAVVRLGMVQACLGAIVVMTTSTLNRVMVVEWALPALLPGILVAVHYAVQILRPRMGYGSDMGGRRTPWIVGGMAVLGVGGVCAALSTAWMGVNPLAGIVAATLSFIIIGVGVSAAGTTVLVLLAKRVPAQRRAPAATIVWLMMIMGFAVTAGVAGSVLDPFSPARLVAVMSAVCSIAFAVTLVALKGLEGSVQPAGAKAASDASPAMPPFRLAMAQVWSEPVARRFTVFVFVSMLAFSAQDLILEPFAGSVFGFTPGESTQLSGVQHGGVLLGMLSVALAGSGLLGRRIGSLRLWVVGGCVASAVTLLGLFMAGLVGPAWPLRPTVFAMGVANGAFSIAAIATMMRLANEGRHAREGVRMGLWGAAQAVAFAMGGLIGTGASDLSRWLVADIGLAYALVFLAEAVLFLVAAALAVKACAPAPAAMAKPPAPNRSPALSAAAQLAALSTYEVNPTPTLSGRPAA